MTSTATAAAVNVISTAAAAALINRSVTAGVATDAVKVFALIKTVSGNRSNE